MKITHNKVGQNLNLVDSAKSDATKNSAAASALGEASNSAKTNKMNRADRDSSVNGAKGAEKLNPAQPATVTVSERAQDAKKIKEIAMSTPDVDPAKVAKYKKMIDEGTYKVDAKAVADRMVDEHLGMSDLGKSQE